jgi:hypothetical protein
VAEVNDVTPLFRVVCPTCGTPTDHDGKPSCARMILGIRRTIADALEIHTFDEEGFCVVCDEMWPCATERILRPLR